MLLSSRTNASWLSSSRSTRQSSHIAQATAQRRIAFKCRSSRSTINVKPGLTRCSPPCELVEMDWPKIDKTPTLKANDIKADNDNVKPVFSNNLKTAIYVKHTVLFPVLAVLSTATAFAEAGPAGWGGLVVLGSLLASWMAPLTTQAFATTAVQVVGSLVLAFKPVPIANSKTSTPAQQVTTPKAPKPTAADKIKSYPIDLVPCRPLNWDHVPSQPLKLDETEQEKEPKACTPIISKAPSALPLGPIVATHPAVLPLASDPSPLLPKGSPHSVGLAALLSPAALSAPLVPKEQEEEVQKPQATPAIAVSAPLPVVSKAPTVPSPSAAAHAAAQGALLVSSHQKVAQAGLCLGLPEPQGRAQPGGLIYSHEFSIKGLSHWVNAGNASRLQKVQQEVATKFLPSSVAPNAGAGLPRLPGTPSMATLLATEWKDLRVYATTPADWPTDTGKLVTYGDLQVVAAYGIEASHS